MEPRTGPFAAALSLSSLSPCYYSRNMFLLKIKKDECIALLVFSAVYVFHLQLGNVSLSIPGQACCQQPKALTLSEGILCPSVCVVDR